MKGHVFKVPVRGSTGSGVGGFRWVFSEKRRQLPLLGEGQGGESRGRFVQAWL